jgi:hypothetical protein
MDRATIRSVRRASSPLKPGFGLSGVVSHVAGLVGEQNWIVLIHGD